MAVGSLTVKMAIIWLWLRGRRAGSINVMTAAGETLGSSGVQKEPVYSIPAAKAKFAPKIRAFEMNENQAYGCILAT